MLTKADLYLLKELNAINMMHAQNFLRGILREKAKNSYKLVKTSSL